MASDEKATRIPTMTGVAEKLAEVSEVMDEMLFRPEDSHRRVKAAFWMRMRDTPLRDPDSVTAADVEYLTKDSRISKWWSKPGFRSWFTNNKSMEERFEYLLDRWCDSVDCILYDEDPKSYNAKIHLGKLLIDQTGRAAASRKEVKVLDTTLPQTKEELEEFIKQGTLKIAK